ncbi:unnamed protein product, partial [Ixodes pacificus]
MGYPGEAKRATRREAAVARAPRVTRHLSPPSARWGPRAPWGTGRFLGRPAQRLSEPAPRRLPPASSPANGTPSAAIRGQKSTGCPHKQLGTAGRETGTSPLTFITTPGAPRGGRVLAARPHPGEPDVPPEPPPDPTHACMPNNA